MLEPTTKSEAKYCDRNICLKNEYNNIGCEDCEVTKSQEPTTRNCFGCKYSKDNHNSGTEECHLCMWENQYTPNNKNDLGVDCISRADAIRVASGYCHPSNVAKELAKLPSMGRYDPYTDKFIKE